jgi:hypothetical protein
MMSTMVVRNKRELLAAYQAAAGEFDCEIELHRKDGGITRYRTTMHVDEAQVRRTLARIRRTPARVFE